MRRAGAGALALALAAALATGSARAAEAGAADASEAPVDHFTPAQAQGFAQAIAADLHRRGVRLAMVFRSGEAHDKLPPGVRYTHGAFWVARGDGYVVENLFAGDGRQQPARRSHLREDRPLDFVRGSGVDDVGVIVPTPELQARVLALMGSPRYAALHNPSYSLIANPWSPLHQNCNGFMLDVMATAAWTPPSPAALRAEERARFQPAVIHATWLERLFAPLKDRRIRLDDQDAIIRTVTYGSLARFMAQQGLVQTTYILTRRP